MTTAHISEILKTYANSMKVRRVVYSQPDVDVMVAERGIRLDIRWW